VSRDSGDIDSIRTALRKYLEENNIGYEIGEVERLEGSAYVINVGVKKLENYSGSGRLYNKLYDIIMEKASESTIVLNLEPI